MVVLRSHTEFLQQLGEGTRDLLEPSEIMGEVARLLGEYLQVSRCAWADVEADENHFSIEQDYTRGCESVVGQYDLNMFGTEAERLRQGERLVVNHVSEELTTEVGKETFQAIGIEAIVCCSLIKQGRMTCMMAIHQIEPRIWTTDEIALTEEVCERCWDTIERARAEKIARRREEQFFQLFDFSPEAMVLVDKRGQIEHINRKAEALFGYARGEAERLSIDALLPDLKYENTESKPDDGDVIDAVRKDGSEFKVEPNQSPIDTARGKLTALSLRDVTERLELEDKLRQSQKMETIGQLAGGVAHDFNNLLTIIINSVELVQSKTEQQTDLHQELKLILDASENAAQLTGQLLAFSRQQRLNPSNTDLHDTIDKLSPMITRLIGTQFNIDIRKQAPKSLVHVDRNQLEQVILNLVVNARDAMGTRGKLTISTQNLPGLTNGSGTGSKVQLTVQDTGRGIKQEVLQRVFDPFFTTKSPGKGTGLGLATVYGIVKQSGGEILVDTQIDQGTAFRVIFPIAKAVVPETDAVSTPIESASNHETILLVEDNAEVRAVSILTLEALGYRVVESASAEDALRQIENGLAFDVLMTDVVMPDMNGIDLSERVRLIHPDCKILFASGYAPKDLNENLKLDGNQGFISKPYRKAGLDTELGRLLRD